MIGLAVCLVISAAPVLAQSQDAANGVLTPQTSPNFPLAKQQGTSPAGAEPVPLRGPLGVSPGKAAGTAGADAGGAGKELRRKPALGEPLPPLAGQATYTLGLPDPDLYGGHRLLPARERSGVFRQAQEARAPSSPFTLVSSVNFALDNYPKIFKQRADILAKREAVALQKAKEYTPYSQLEYQEVMASHNKLAQVIWGDEVFPATMGPGFPSVSMDPLFFSGAGWILDWSPIDFGLHKARISQSKSEFNLARAAYGLTRLDVAVAAASAFMDVVVAHQVVLAQESNVKTFQDVSTQVHAQVDAKLVPGADASLADAQLANARNDLIRAKLLFELSMAELAGSMGLSGQRIQVEPDGLDTISEPADVQQSTPVFESHPLAVVGKASILTAAAERHVYERMYYPIIRFLGGTNQRGSGYSVNSRNREQSANVHGLFPTVPNYHLGVILDFPFMDYWKIKYQKQMLTRSIQSRQYAYDQIIQDLRVKDVQARASVSAAVALAANMPVQVHAAYLASQQALARYNVGLTTIAQVAQANQLLADSRMKEAVARIGVWKALLKVAYAHGDIQPFLNEAAGLPARGIPQGGGVP